MQKQVLYVTVVVIALQTYYFFRIKIFFFSRVELVES